MCDPRGVRGVGLVLVVSACGRLGFDGALPRDDAPRDDAPTEPEIAVDAQLPVDAPVLALDAGDCPASYTRLGTSCYRYSAVQVPTWLDGELLCEADGVGAHLATIDGEAEAVLLASAFDVNDFWIGMTDRSDEGMYRNVTGELAPYLVWVPGEPTSSDCGQLDQEALFHVSTCDTSDEYLCEYDDRPAAAGAY